MISSPCCRHRLSHAELSGDLPDPQHCTPASCCWPFWAWRLSALWAGLAGKPDAGAAGWNSMSRPSVLSAAWRLPAPRWRPLPPALAMLWPALPQLGDIGRQARCCLQAQRNGVLHVACAARTPCPAQRSLAARARLPTIRPWRTGWKPATGHQHHKSPCKRCRPGVVKLASARRPGRCRSADRRQPICTAKPAAAGAPSSRASLWSRHAPVTGAPGCRVVARKAAPDPACVATGQASASTACRPRA